MTICHSSPTTQVTLFKTRLRLKVMSSFRRKELLCLTSPLTTPVGQNPSRLKTTEPRKRLSFHRLTPNLPLPKESLGQMGLISKKSKESRMNLNSPRATTCNLTTACIPHSYRSRKKSRPLESSHS